MNIVNGRPPNFDQIAALFPEAHKEGVIFTYGETVYVVGSDSLIGPLRAHEAVHVQRQLKAGVETWWGQYLVDAEFRLAEELPAHRAEYQTIVGQIGRIKARHYMEQIAGRLCGPLYGGIISEANARKALLR